MTWMQTRFSNAMDLADPQPDDVDIRDIAYSLGGMGRFACHTTVTPYTVAEHSFWVTRYIEATEKDAPHDLLLGALLHDAAEAYTGDATRPLKQALRKIERDYYKGAFDRESSFDRLSFKVEDAVHTRFGTTSRHEIPIIKRADMALLAAEQKFVMAEPPEEWRSTEDYSDDDVAVIVKKLRADWPQTLRFPVGPTVDWEETFLLEFARLHGGAAR
jgi:5'-deoxynucleotidase YfbR-like HD superfamily hydrolase